MASREQSVDNLLKIVSGIKDRRQKYPFPKWDRMDFQSYCRCFKITALSKKSQQFVYWFVLYEHYKRYRTRRNKRTKLYLSPKDFLALLRYFYPALDKRRTKFKIKVPKVRLGCIRIEKARLAHRQYKWKKAQQDQTQLSDAEE